MSLEEMRRASAAELSRGYTFTGELPSAPSSRSQWPSDPFVLHTQYFPAYRALRKAATRDPQARAYLQNAPGPKFMRRMTAAKVVVTLLLAAIGQ